MCLLLLIASIISHFFAFKTRFYFNKQYFISRGRYSEEPPKSCCGLLAWKPGSLRWFIAMIALIAVCCVLVGTALGAMRPAGRDHLTVSLLMIGKSKSKSKWYTFYLNFLKFITYQSKLKRLLQWLSTISDCDTLILRVHNRLFRGTSGKFLIIPTVQNTQIEEIFTCLTISTGQYVNLHLNNWLCGTF